MILVVFILDDVERHSADSGQAELVGFLVTHCGGHGDHFFQELGGEPVIPPTQRHHGPGKFHLRLGALVFK